MALPLILFFFVSWSILFTFSNKSFYSLVIINISLNIFVFDIWQFA